MLNQVQLMLRSNLPNQGHIAGGSQLSAENLFPCLSTRAHCFIPQFFQAGKQEGMNGDSGRFWGQLDKQGDMFSLMKMHPAADKSTHPDSQRLAFFLN